MIIMNHQYLTRLLSMLTLLKFRQLVHAKTLRMIADDGNSSVVAPGKNKSYNTTTTKDFSSDALYYLSPSETTTTAMTTTTTTNSSGTLTQTAATTPELATAPPTSTIPTTTLTMTTKPPTTTPTTLPTTMTTTATTTIPITAATTTTIEDGTISQLNTCKQELITELQCDRSEDSCRRRCNVHGTTYLYDAGKCCSHEGVVATLLAFERDDLWVQRLSEFNDCTGGEIRLKYNPGGEDDMASDVLHDVGGSDGTGGEIQGANIYDAYIVQAPWIPAAADGLADLNSLIAENSETIRWLDINPISRSTVSFEGRVKALPLDTDYIAFGYRQDVFEKHNISGPPQTLDEMVELSEFLNGKDHNGDGIPDWGFCLTPQSNYFMAFVAPLLQTHLQECREDSKGERVCNGAQTRQNIFFDADTFTPMIHNEAFRHAVTLYQRFLMASNCQSQTGNAGHNPELAYCNRKTAAPTGRCAGVISMPGTMTKLLQNGKYGVADGEPDGPLYEMPLPVFNDTSKYWGRRTRFPGSSKVLDWSTGVYGKLKNCTPELCPKAIAQPDGTYVNFAPFFAEGGESYAISRASKGGQKNAMWDLFSWLADFGNGKADSDLVPLGGKYRISQLRESNATFNTDSKEYWMGNDLNSVLKFYFADDQTGGGNAVQDLLIIGFSEYMNALDEEIHDNFLLAKGIGFQDFRNHPEKFDIYYNEFIAALSTRYEEITSKYGHMKQLQRWRNSLNLQVNTDEEICARTLTSEENFDRYWVDGAICSQFVLRDLCDTERKSVIAFDANSCRTEGAGTSYGVKVTLVVMGAVGAGFTLIVFAWITKYRNHPIVRVSQVFFLYLIVLGSMISISTIFLLPIEGSNAACMAQAWLSSVGFAITFSCLFAKTWRIKKMMQAATQFKKVKIKQTTMLKWTALSLLVVGIVLLTWTILSPMQWYDNGIDSPRCTLTDGTYHATYFTVPLGLFMFVVYLFGNILLYQARNVQTIFAEREWIHTTMFANFEINLIGLPVLLLVVNHSADASLMIKGGVLFLNTTTLLVLLFVPKMYNVATITEDEAAAIVRAGIRSRARNNDGGISVASGYPESCYAPSAGNSVISYGRSVGNSTNGRTSYQPAPCAYTAAPRVSPMDMVIDSSHHPKNMEIEMDLSDTTAMEEVPGNPLESKPNNSNNGMKPSARGSHPSTINSDDGSNNFDLESGPTDSTCDEVDDNTPVLTGTSSNESSSQDDDGAIE